MSREEFENTDLKVNPELMPGWNERQGLPETNAQRQKERDSLLRVRPTIDANSFEDIESEKLCQFCVHFRDKKNYLGQITHYCAKSKYSLINTASKCFNNKFERA